MTHSHTVRSHEEGFGQAANLCHLKHVSLVWSLLHWGKAVQILRRKAPRWIQGESEYFAIVCHEGLRIFGTLPDYSAETEKDFMMAMTADGLTKTLTALASEIEETLRIAHETCQGLGMTDADDFWEVSAQGKMRRNNSWRA